MSGRIDPAIIFVSGFPRSGTTLLISLLDGHPSLIVCPLEIHFISDFYRILGNRNDCVGNDFLQYIFKASEFYTIGGFARVAGGAPYDLTSVDKRIFQSSLDVLKDREVSITDALYYLMDAFSRAQYGNKVPFSKSHFVIKVNDVAKLDKYLEIFPESKIIICVRHPMPYFESRLLYHYNAYQTNYPPHFSSIIHEDSLLHYETGLEQIQRNIDNNRCLINKLENMHANPREVMLKVAKFIGIQYDESLIFPTILNKPYEGNTVYKNKRSTNISKYTYDRKSDPFQEYVVSNRINPEPLYPQIKGGIKPNVWSAAFYRLTKEEKIHFRLSSIFAPIGGGGRLERLLSHLPSILRPLARLVINPILWVYRLKELPFGYIRYRKWLLKE